MTELIDRTAAPRYRAAVTPKSQRRGIVMRFNLLFIFIALFVVASVSAPQFLTTQKHGPTCCSSPASPASSRSA